MYQDYEHFLVERRKRIAERLNAFLGTSQDRVRVMLMI